MKLSLRPHSFLRALSKYMQATITLCSGDSGRICLRTAGWTEPMRLTSEAAFHDELPLLAALTIHVVDAFRYGVTEKTVH